MPLSSQTTGPSSSVDDACYAFGKALGMWRHNSLPPFCLTVINRRIKLFSVCVRVMLLFHHMLCKIINKIVYNYYHLMDEAVVALTHWFNWMELKHCS